MTSSPEASPAPADKAASAKGGSQNDTADFVQDTLDLVYVALDHAAAVLSARQFATTGEAWRLRELARNSFSAAAGRIHKLGAPAGDSAAWNTIAKTFRRWVSETSGTIPEPGAPYRPEFTRPGFEAEDQQDLVAARDVHLGELAMSMNRQSCAPSRHRVLQLLSFGTDSDYGEWLRPTAKSLFRGPDAEFERAIVEVLARDGILRPLELESHGVRMPVIVETINKLLRSHLVTAVAKEQEYRAGPVQQSILRKHLQSGRLPVEAASQSRTRTPDNIEEDEHGERRQ